MHIESRGDITPATSPGQQLQSPVSSLLQSNFLLEHANYVNATLDRAQAAGRIDTEARQRFEQLFLRELPTLEGSGLSAQEFEGFIWETTQLACACISRPKVRDYGITEVLIQKALNDGPEARRGFIIDPMNDSIRGGISRERGTIGQIREFGDPSSSLAGAWPARRSLEGQGMENARVGFKLTARHIESETRILPVPINTQQYFEHLARVEKRLPNPWRVQVSAGTSLDEWVIKVAGSDRIGQRVSYEPLGVYSEAVMNVLEGHDIRHYLLPRSRRDRQTEVWHSAAFLIPIDQNGKFEWNGYGIQYIAGDPQLVKARVAIQLQVAIEQFFSICPKQGR